MKENEKDNESKNKQKSINSNKINESNSDNESEGKKFLKNSKNENYNDDQNNKFKYTESMNINNNSKMFNNDSKILASQPNKKTQEEIDEEEFKEKGVFGLLKEGKIVKVLTGTRKHGNALQRLGVGTAVGAAAGCLCGAIGASLGTSVLGMASTFGGAFTDIGVKSLMAGSILGNCFCIK